MDDEEKGDGKMTGATVDAQDTEDPMHAYMEQTGTLIKEKLAYKSMQIFNYVYRCVKDVPKVKHELLAKDIHADSERLGEMWLLVCKLNFLPHPTLKVLVRS